MKKFTKILLLVLILLTINVNVYAEEDLSKATWWVYDHTNYQDKAIVSDEQHRYIEYHYEDPKVQNYVLDRHISILNDGKAIDFKGYGTNGYTDFVYYPSKSNSSKTFSLNISKAHEDNDLGLRHAFAGLSIFFNANITGNYEDDTQVLNSYAIHFTPTGTFLLELKNLNTKKLLNGEYNVIFPRDFTEGGHMVTNDESKIKMLGQFYTIIDNPYNKIKLVIDNNIVKLYAHTSTEYYSEDLTDWNLMEWELPGRLHEKEVKISSSTGGYGFGLGVFYKGHECHKKTNFVIYDLSLPVKLDLESPILETTPSIEDTTIENPVKEEPTEEEIIQSCSDAEYREKYPELCNRVECVGFEGTKLGVFLQDIFTYMQIGVVVLLILTGSIDFVKAMSSKDSQQMKKFQNDFIKRLIIGAVIFFVPALVNFLFPLLGIGGSCGIK